MALSVSSQLSSKLSVVTQLEAVNEEGEVDLELDFAFASWKFSDQAVLKAGSVKLPFGIWTEVFDVGTVRPFLDLPQGIYGPVGTVGERYQGIGFSGQAGNRWRVNFVSDRPGPWYYWVSFRSGSQVAISPDPLAGSPASFHASSRIFSLRATSPRP